jgi:IS605 OrfB family transposase
MAALTNSSGSTLSDGRLVRENQTLVIEDLTVRNMVKNHTLARAISDASWSEFRSMLEYKAAWYGREVIAVDRFFPSSRLCSVCGTLQEKMPLSVRTWTCERSMLGKLGYEAEAHEKRTIHLLAHKRYWRQSKLKAPSIAMNNAYWDAQGYRSLKGSWSRRQPA